MKISIQSFKGVAPKIARRYLPEGAAQVAVNVEVFGQSLKPLKGLLAAGRALGSAVRSLYKFGQNNTSDSDYWFTWSGAVDTCRSQIAGDGTAEWTFFTGDGYPKGTHNGIAAVGGYPLPNNSLRLGLPAPVTRPTGTVQGPAHCEVGGVRAESKTTKAECEAVAYCAVGGNRNDSYTTKATCEAAGVCKVNGTLDASKTTRATCEAATGGVW